MRNFAQEEVTRQRRRLRAPPQSRLRPRRLRTNPRRRTKSGCGSCSCRPHRPSGAPRARRHDEVRPRRRQLRRRPRMRLRLRLLSRRSPTRCPRWTVRLRALRACAAPPRPRRRPSPPGGRRGRRSRPRRSEPVAKISSLRKHEQCASLTNAASDRWSQGIHSLPNIPAQSFELGASA